MTKTEANYYVADNNEVFPTEEQCIEYEKTVLNTSLKGKMFNKDFRPVEWFSTAYYFILSDDKDIAEVERLNKLYFKYPIGIDGAGFYCFNKLAKNYINLTKICQYVSYYFL